MGTGLGVDGQATVTGLADFFQRVVATQMDDVDRRTGHFGESDGPGGGFGFRRGRASQGMVFGSGLAFSQGLLDDHVDGAAIFRMHADHGSGLGGSAHGLENAGIVQHEDAGISHEQLETADSLAHQLRHFCQLRIGQVGDDAVEPVIGHCFGRCLLHPGIERSAQGLAFVLDRKVDQGGSSTEGGSAGAGFEIVRAGGASKWHIEVSVHIDAAWEDVLAGGINQAFGIFTRQAAAQGNHPAVFDGDIGLTSVRSRDHSAAGNDGVEPHWLIPCAPEVPSARAKA